jgi:hypothetical protein
MLQKIVVFIRLEDSDSVIIPYGVHLARAFRKELCLFYHSTEAFHAEMTEDKLKKYKQSIHLENPSLSVSFLIGKFKREHLAVVLADEHEAILLVAGAATCKTLSRSLQNSPIPFLYVNERYPCIPDFSTIFFPVDLRIQNRDAMKWILYFGRYIPSEIVVIGANDKSKSNRRLVNGNVSMIRKNLVKFGIQHRIYQGNRSSLRIQEEGFVAATLWHAGMLVLLGSSVITVLDMIIGLPEEKIVRQARGLAVLVVNPRRETYLACE